MESKFKYTAYLTIALMLAFPAIQYFIFLNRVQGPDSFLIVFFIAPYLSLLIFIASDLRLKLVKIIIDSREVTIKNFLGFGWEKTYRLKDLDGFYTSEIRGRHKMSDLTYLMYNGKKVAKIASQYHANYDELHKIVSDNLTNLGHINSNLLTELKDAVRF